MRARLRPSRAILLGAILVAGCSRREPREIANAFQWSEQIPAGTTLHIRDLNGSVRVVPATGALATVSGSKQWRHGRESDVRFVANRVGQDVYVCALWGSRSRCDQNGYESNSGFSIWNLFSLRRHSTDMRADFAVQLPPGVNVDIMAIHGDASIDRAAGNVRVRLVSGSITANDASGALTLETVNGSITAGLDTLTGTGPLDFASVNGSIHVALPASLQGDVTLQTVSGRVSSDFPLQASDAPASHSLHGVLGAGGRTISLRTVSGAVELVRKG